MNSHQRKSREYALQERGQQSGARRVSEVWAGGGRSQTQVGQKGISLAVNRNKLAELK